MSSDTIETALTAPPYAQPGTTASIRSDQANPCTAEEITDSECLANLGSGVLHFALAVLDKEEGYSASG